MNLEEWRKAVEASPPDECWHCNRKRKVKVTLVPTSPTTYSWLCATCRREVERLEARAFNREKGV